MVEYIARNQSWWGQTSFCLGSILSTLEMSEVGPSMTLFVSFKSSWNSLMKEIACWFPAV